MSRPPVRRAQRAHHSSTPPPQPSFSIPPSDQPPFEHQPRSDPPTYVSSRAAYPTFLSAQDTARLHLSCAGRGLLDACRWDTVVRVVASDPEVRSHVLKSLALNTVSLLSVYFFDWLVLPLARGQQRWFHRNLGWFYQVLWLLPVVGASFYLNSSWCTLIAKRTFTLQHGARAAAQPPGTYSGVLNALATSAYRAVMIGTSVVLSVALEHVPFVGPPLGFTFLCWVDAYYCFEFIWIARGLSLSRRVRHLEERWAYYFAFGLPSAALCMWGSSLANAALFALLFPSYIIMAMHARPAPRDPYNPAAAADDGGVRYPSPLFPIRIPVFAPVLFLNDAVVRVLSVGTGGRASASASAAYTYGGGSGDGGGHRRMFSDGAESIEEGTALSEVGDRGGAGRLGGPASRVRVRGPQSVVSAAGSSRAGRKFD
ncbi:etoposide-induced protein 2.4-domain-containing protein [Epithele typhae]|uniref:etoposide-induced protein 2.4-domain-containing protein n=1 Tax=Epithele typhae TaxID=378194 RepID=UPI002008D3A6|nr:etoposide-induced protein 2.4-domain-containing protein [Epithele typhae]KAH9923932.1 etoposide-induced protein 2.4-domain-containing protein [Epithele typhae]